MPRSIFSTVAALALLAPAAAFAASPDAWKEFRHDVEAACLTASAPLLRPQPQITVDPFGSQSYGLAFLRGLAAEDGASRALVCIYDKKARTAEIGGTMALENAVPALQAVIAPASDPIATSTAEAATPQPAPNAPSSGAVAASIPDVASEVSTSPADAAGASGSPAAAGAPPTRLAAAPAPDAAPAASPAPATPSAASRSQAAAALEDRFMAPADPAAAAQAATEVAAYAPSNGGDPLAKAFAGRCDATCAVTLTALADPDRASLIDLGAEIDRTLAAHPGAKLAAGPEAARAVAAAMAASAAGAASTAGAADTPGAASTAGAASATGAAGASGTASAAGAGGAGVIATPTRDLAGERSCVLTYFGYENQAARTVARHRCRITAGDNGGLVVEKTSGERLHAEIRPLTPDFSAFVGRTFEAGQAETEYNPQKPVSSVNKELGNTVGFAAAKDGRLMLVSSQRRRFADQGDFFWVLAVDPG